MLKSTTRTTKLLLHIALAFTYSALLTSCSKDSNDLDETAAIVSNETIGTLSTSNLSETSPFGFSDDFMGDDFQVDNDGNGAHNWDVEEYDEAPEDNGFDIRDFIFTSESRLILICPDSEHDSNDSDSRRRAEYRDQTNIDLSDAHSMELTFDIKNYDNESELIMAQLHNDNPAASRPFITVLSEEGVIRLQRTNAPTGSSSLRGSQTIPFREDDRYTIRLESVSGNRSIFGSIVNLDTGEEAENTFNFVEDWDALDGDFYWKFGAYMPDGGSENTQMRLESINIPSGTSPFGFSDNFMGDDFQVDNDGNGAHNWNVEEYDEAPEDNGFDIRDFIFTSGSRLILICPDSEHDPNDSDSRRRAEFRDQVNLDLSDAHSMDLTFDIRNYDNESELIMAQLHNDNPAARRPFITVLAEEGVIRLQRTNAPTGSSTQRASETIPFREDGRYRIRLESVRGNRSVFASIVNLDTDEEAENTFNFASDWDALDGDFYWKFGAYMPDGGSDNTQMRLESINILGQ